jgi:glutamine cyclotransferase
MRPRLAPLGGRVTLVVVLTLALSAPLAAGRLTSRTVIRTPAYPIWAVSGYGAIWVGAHHDTVLYRISPKTDRVVGTIRLQKTPCGQPALGVGAIFVPDCRQEGGNTLEVSAKTGRVVRTFTGGMGVFADHSLWTLTDSGAFVQRFDPKTGVRLARIPTGVADGAGGGLEYLGASGAGAVWLGDQAAKTVLRIDTGTNKVTAVIPLPGAATQASPEQGYAAGGPMAFANGKVWYANPAGVYEIDPATNQATLLRVKIGNLWAWGDIVFTAGAGSVWVRASGTTVARIDPATGDVIANYRATGGGGGIAVAFGSLWVANAGADTTWREPIR